MHPWSFKFFNNMQRKMEPKFLVNIHINMSINMSGLLKIWGVQQLNLIPKLDIHKNKFIFSTELPKKTS